MDCSESVRRKSFHEPLPHSTTVLPVAEAIQRLGSSRVVARSEEYKVEGFEPFRTRIWPSAAAWMVMAKSDREACTNRSSVPPCHRTRNNEHSVLFSCMRHKPATIE